MPVRLASAHRNLRISGRWGRIFLLLAVHCTLWVVPRDAAADPVIIEDDTPPDRPLLALDSYGHTGAVYKLKATQYGDQLVSVGVDKTIRFWDIATGQPTRVLRPPIARANFGILFALAVSPDGKRLAVGGYRALTPLYDHRIHLISLPEGQIVHSLKGHVFAIQDLAFSPDGQQLASASYDKTVRIWDVESGTPTKMLQGHADVVTAVAWSPDGKRLVSGSDDKTARIWSAETGATDAVLSGHTARLSSAAWSPDGRSIATGGADHSIRLYEPNGKLRYTWRNLHNEVTAVVFAPDSKRLLYAYASNDQPPVGASILDMVDGHERCNYTGHDNGVVCGVWLHDGQRVVTGDSVSGIRMWDSATGKTVRRMDGLGRPVFAAGWSPDGQAVAWGNSSNNDVVDIGPPLQRTFCFNNLDFGPPPDNRFVRAQPRMGGLKIGIALDGGRTNLRKMGIERSGDMVSTFLLPQPDDHVRSYSLLTGNRAVVGCDAGAYLVETSTGRMLRELNDRSGETWGLAPSPDFRYLLTASNDQISRVWRLDTGEVLVALFVAGDEWIAWTPQGYYAASLQGESLMGWHINQGPTQMAAFYPASQFHKSLYRPDIIRRLLTAGDVYKSLALADSERAIQSQKLVVADVLPPQVTITNPAERRVELQQAEITVHATAKPVDKDPVKAMRLIVDGRPYGAAQALPAPAADADTPVEQQWTVQLPPGKHQVVVKAETADSYGLSRPLEVDSSPAAGGDSAAEKIAAAGTLYVLAIGADPPTTVPNPTTRAKDAQAIVGALDKAGKPQFNKVITRELAGPAATPAAINQQLEQMRSQMTLADTGIVYYAGQDSLDAGGNYVLGGAPQASSAQADIPATSFQAHLASIPGRLVLMLDLTHAAEHARRQAAAGYCGSTEKQDGGRQIEAKAAEWLRELLTEDCGVVVISASRAAGAAPGTSPTGLSPLTQAFSEAIGGRADANGDGTVDLQELAPYVTTRVRALTGGRQTPTIERPRGVSSFPLAKPAPPAR